MMLASGTSSRLIPRKPAVISGIETTPMHSDDGGAGGHEPARTDGVGEAADPGTDGQGGPPLAG
jgi:hypothetical protein